MLGAAADNCNLSTGEKGRSLEPLPAASQNDEFQDQWDLPKNKVNGIQGLALAYTCTQGIPRHDSPTTWTHSHIHVHLHIKIEKNEAKM